MESSATRSADDVPAITGYSRREQIGWYFYDWGASAFSTTVVTVFLGPYLTAVTEQAADASGFVHLLGVPVLAGSFFPYVVSLSVLLQVFFLPILGALADYSHRKRQFLAFFAYFGAIATMAMYFLQGDRYLLGGGLFLIANVSFGAAFVFYNAFLPEIASSEDRDRVSSQGWALGYLGGGLLLALNLVFVQFLAEPLGVSTAHAIRISLLSAGLWWAIFTVIPLTRLKRRRSTKSLPPGDRYATVGFKQLARTFRALPSFPQTLLFLLAYLLYNDGIQTVITLSATFGAAELGLQTATLVQVILMVQFVAFGGALLFNKVADWFGTKRAILISLIIWLGVTVYTYAFLRTAVQFFVLAGFIAIVLGGSQALSRSLYSLMIPSGQEAEYFSLYEISERGTSWLGPLLFGLTLQFTGSYRFAILSIAVFFAAGTVLLFFVDARRAVLEAGNVAPARL